NCGLRLWPARRHGARHGFRLRRCSCRNSLRWCRSWFIQIGQDGVIVVVVFCEQWCHFAEFLRRLLQHLNLLSQLGVLGLFTPQNLVDVLHTTPPAGNSPMCEFKDAWNQGQRGTTSIGYGSNDKHEGSEALWSTACLADFRLFARNPDGRL